MTEREYNDLDAVRRTDLWRIMDSPEKYLYGIQNREEPTPALLFGAAAHKMVLEPDTFFAEYAVSPTVDRRTKAGREQYEAFCAESSGKTIISEGDLTTIRAMAEKLRNTPLTKALLQGEHESVFMWTDQDTNLMCKTRLDCLTKYEGRLTVVDYKTAASAKSEAFNQSMFKNGYHMQAFMYTEAVMQAQKLSERPDFVFIVQEKKPPYAVNVIQVTDDVMMAGQDAFRECIGTLKECLDTGYFWGYNGRYNEPNDTFLPGWMNMGEDEEGDLT